MCFECVPHVHVLFVFALPSKGRSVRTNKTLQIDSIFLKHFQIVVGKIMANDGNQPYRCKQPRCHRKKGRRSSQHVICFCPTRFDGIEGYSSDDQNRSHKDSFKKWKVESGKWKVETRSIVFFFPLCTFHFRLI